MTTIRDNYCIWVPKRNTDFLKDNSYDRETSMSCYNYSLNNSVISS